MSTQRKKINGKWHIRRSGYTRKGYTRSDGTRVKGIKVSATWILDRGKPGKGPKLISIKKDKSLTKLGYKLSGKADTRHRALNKAVSKYGSLSVLRKVNALSVLLKNTEPKYASNATSDKRYLQKKYYN